jgi:MFS transporter, UMF1 family
MAASGDVAELLPAGAGGRAGVLGRLSWAVFDGTRGPYGSLVTLFIFSAYFATVVIPDPIRGQTLWGYANALAAALVAVGAPIVGAIADAGGRRKPWIAACMLVGIPAMALLCVATPDMHAHLAWVVVALVFASASIEYAAIFLNAMLPNIAVRSHIGVLSGLGLSLANLSNIIVLLFFLFAWSWSAQPLFGLDPTLHEPERAVGPIAALWWLVFGLPLFLFTPDSAATGANKLQAIRQGFRSLGDTVPKLRRYANTTRFLIARMVFNEGFIIMMMLTGVYAAGMLHWTPRMLIAQGLINSLCAAISGFVAGWLDRRCGSRISTVIFVSGCLATNLVLLSLTPTSVLFFDLPASAASGGLFAGVADKVFSATIAATAVFVTAGFASSRALMAKLAPAHLQNEFFGLYALSGTATSFFGPLAIALATAALHDQRGGVAVGIVFLSVGLWLLCGVREESRAGVESGELK